MNRRALILSATLTAAGVMPAVSTASTRWESPQSPDARRCNRAPASWTRPELRCVVHAIFPRSEWRNAEKVVECESSWNIRAYNVHAGGSTDAGLWQINSTYNADGYGVAYHPVAATVYARFVLRTRGWGDWVCARLTGVS